METDESLQQTFQIFLEATHKLTGDVKKTVSNLEQRCKDFESRNQVLVNENKTLKTESRQLMDIVDKQNEILSSKENQLKYLERQILLLNKQKAHYKKVTKKYFQEVSEQYLDQSDVEELWENKKRANNEEEETKRRKLIPSHSTVANDISQLASLASPSLDSTKTGVPDQDADACANDDFIQSKIQLILDFPNLMADTQHALRLEKERKKENDEKQQKCQETHSLPREQTLVLDFDNSRQLLTVEKRLASKLKPHQLEGVRFMFNSCFQSIKTSQNGAGGGCILNHFTGLGKTLQVVALSNTLIRNFQKTKVKRILVICPVNTVQHWLDEFAFWLKDHSENDNVPVYEMSCVRSSISERDRKRMNLIKAWYKNGGVFLIGYGMFQNFLSQRIDNNATECDIFLKAFINPGADLVVCDDGHLLKSEEVYFAINKVHTLRRIILTGLPLQGHLSEYFAMMQFVKPGLLGNEKEFHDRFAGPIVNERGTIDEDITLTKLRACVLHKLLEGCVQTRNFSALTEFLPQKREYTLMIRLTKVQVDLYKFYMTNCVSKDPTVDLLPLRMVCNHPNTLIDFAEKRANPKAKTQEKNSGDSKEPVSSENVNVEWWNGTFSPDKHDFKTGKVHIFFAILYECELRGEKLAVFSSCSSTLNVLEHFLTLGGTQQVEEKRTWTVGHDYFRSDENGFIHKRDIASFNDGLNNRARLLLILKGSEGIEFNVCAADRVILFDISLDPTHDVQSITRAYRMGRKKECFVYRLIALGTMEQFIYDQQVSGNRVIGQQFYCDKELLRGRSPEAQHCPTEDELLNSVLQRYHNYMIYDCRAYDLFKPVSEDALNEMYKGDLFEEFVI